MRVFAVLSVIVLFQPAVAFAQESSPPPAIKISQFSGKPVPRFENLKFAAVHGRKGPSLDHPIVWKYERRGLPVLILKESRDWRFVRDPDGDEVWVHARMLASGRNALVREDTELKRKADDEARSVALMKSGAIIQLLSCSVSWCEVSSGRYKGYVERKAVWGSYEQETGL